MQAKSGNSNPIFTALFIGFLIGIVIYSLAVNRWGWLTLIPLFLAYQLMKKPNKGNALGQEAGEGQTNE